jgi:DNA helicase-2/ATP-dependent DNA helicase PcrA
MITDEQKAAAQAIQHAAGRDVAARIRLVAGPGTGKSSAIEDRVRWLLANDVPPDRICAVSFTRASALDLRLRIHRHATEPGYEGIDDVRVSTLHSLALRVLRAANQLGAYPVDPCVLDPWEVKSVFDAEFGHVHGYNSDRRKEIRHNFEAFWSTGSWGPPNYIPPDPPITEEERAHFLGFHGPRSRTYACVLPGEIIRRCVELMEHGLLNAVELLHIQHLIVDEFQDLNPNDLRFVHFMIQHGAVVFVAGDDDQSLYSFRFASPAGIQGFPQNYAPVGQHQLTHCFRCPPEILAAGMTLIAANPAPGRIAKALESLYAEAEPPVAGRMFRWRFNHANTEAKAIAASCRRLVDAGMNPREILILLSNQRALGRPLINEMEAAQVPTEHPREESFLDSDPGRLVLALMRIVCDTNDYISHRVVLGLRDGVGMGRCNAVFEAVVNAGINFRGAFYDALPDGAFTGHALTTINLARGTCAALAGWTGEDTLEQRLAAITAIVEDHFAADEAGQWQAFAEAMPQGIMLEELRDFLWADTDEQQADVLTSAMQRLGIEVPQQGPLPPRVRIMTMHGAKGLSAQVVFIPGLEDEIIPGPRRNPYEGLVQEAARMLYVSITRARAACIVSYAQRRRIAGQMQGVTHSRFAPQLAGAFGPRDKGLTTEEVEAIRDDCANL